MAKITVVGDPHAKADNLHKIDQLFDLIEELGNTTVILGDLLDTKEVVRGKCFNKYLERFQKANHLHFLVLVGNHDWFNLECQQHSLEAMKLLPNVTVVDKLHFDHDCAFLPYRPNLHEVWPQIAPLLKGTPVFCHADIKGFDYGNGRISEEGLDASAFNHGGLVISGHYHKFQQRAHITYLGTPFSHSFGEANQEKFIGIFDNETKQLDLIPTKFAAHRSSTLNVNDPAFASNHAAIASNTHDYWRIILEGTQEEIDLVKKRDHIKYIEQPTQQGVSTIITEIESPEQQFEKWATQIKQLSPETVALGMEFLKHV